ncbi:PH domain-containing protein [Oerskovia jenensis]|uniref:PH domain-containing protein n=1 Tax=Oerskovia jenensis TaxID=162169 RepID=UPI0036D7904F
MSSNVTPPPEPAPGNPYATFRPRWGTAVAYTAALVILAGCTFVALVATGPGTGSGWNKAATIGVGAFCALILWRLGQVRATVTPQHLTVHNIVFTRRLDWPQVVSVRFGPGDPWVRLDLSDGKALAVMGIQRADGARRSENEAARLAALVAAHGEGRED